uniref:Uncharacterized protein n=1 Tax=Serratia phage Spe5P4 TaxID=3159438 RepID=A0AAU7VGV1_9CAUD
MQLAGILWLCWLHVKDLFQVSPENPSNFSETFALWQAPYGEPANTNNPYKRPDLLAIRSGCEPELPTIINRGRKLADGDLVDVCACDESSLVWYALAACRATASHSLAVLNRYGHQMRSHQIQGVLQRCAIQCPAWTVSGINERCAHVPEYFNFSRRIQRRIRELRQLLSEKSIVVL